MSKTSQAEPCSCSQIRRAARRISSFYDSMLAPTGLTVTQYALLVNIDRAGRLSRTELAAKVGMERTTLTRNLRPLEKGRLIAAAAAGKDRRERLICLSAAGKRKLRQSVPLWEEAQRRFASGMGLAPLRQLRALLTRVEAAASKAST